jgi:hypothetical protein
VERRRFNLSDPPERLEEPDISGSSLPILEIIYFCRASLLAKLSYATRHGASLVKNANQLLASHSELPGARLSVRHPAERVSGDNMGSSLKR